MRPTIWFSWVPIRTTTTSRSEIKYEEIVQNSTKLKSKPDCVSCLSYFGVQLLKQVI